LATARVVWPFRISALQLGIAAIVLSAAWGGIIGFAAWKLGVPAEWQGLSVAVGLSSGIVGARRTVRRYLAALGMTGWMGPLRFQDDSLAQTFAVFWSIGGVASALVWADVLPSGLVRPALVLTLLSLEAGAGAIAIDSAYRFVSFRRYQSISGRRIVLIRTSWMGGQAWIALEGSEAAPAIPVADSPMTRR